MRRMEVTTESFLWSDKAAQSKEEIRSIVQTHQMHLTAPPMRYQVWAMLCMYVCMCIPSAVVVVVVCYTYSICVMY